MAQITSISFSSPAGEQRPEDRYHRVETAGAHLVADRGIDGDRKGKGGDRQVNIMSQSTLDLLHGEGFKTGAGEMGEQIVVDGIDVDGLPVGSRLRLGVSAIVAVTSARSGCSRFEHIQGKQKKLVRGRLGVMARVVCGGPIAVGDPAAIEPSAE